MPSYARKVFFVTAVAVIFLGGHLYLSSVDYENNQASIQAALDVTKEKETMINFFADLDVEAKAVFVYDTSTNKILHEENSSAQLPLASITKVMTALTALKRESGSEIVPITAQALSEDGDTGLLLGENWKLEDLIRFMLITSSNDAARAISDRISQNVSLQSFTDLMNSDAKTLGLKQTYFLNPSGLDSSESLGGAFGSAEDVSKMFAFALERYPKLFAGTAKREVVIYSVEGFPHIAQNTNKEIDSEVGIVASKTGFTDLAGGNLVVAYDIGPGKRIVATVLGSSAEGRFKDMEMLIDATIKHLTEN